MILSFKSNTSLWLQKQKIRYVINSNVTANDYDDDKSCIQLIYFKLSTTES
jgi:hypothetical protein